MANIITDYDCVKSKLITLKNSNYYSEQYKTKYNKKTFTKILERHKFNKFKIKKIISLFIFLSSANGKLALKLNKKFTDIFKGNTGLLLVAEIQK